MLVLASASPRRSELLRAAGIEFRVHPAQIQEMIRPGESPRDFATRLACEKASAVAALQPKNCFVLGADTIVLADKRVLGKPRDTDEAKLMLRLLAGRAHEVVTGVCLRGPNPDGTIFTDSRSECTGVRFDPLTDDEVEEYIATGEPMDKAGAYGIQGMAARWIGAIDGDYFNVVGLPIALVYRMLREHRAV